MASDKRRDNNRAVLKEGEGQRKDGLYYFRWTDENGKRHYIYADSLQKLRTREDEVSKDRLEGIKTEAKYVTLNDIYELWKDMKISVRDNTMCGYKYSWESFVRDDIGDMRVSDIRKSDIKRFYNRLFEDRRLKIATIDCVHTVLHQVLQIAVDDRFIRNNPSDNALAELKKSHYTRTDKKRALTREEEKLFLDFVRNSETYSHWYPIFAVMDGTGMRVGEVTGLRWCDIDLGEGIISVNHTLVYYNHGDPNNGRGCYYNIHDTKTEAGERTIPMMNQVRKAFLMEKEYQKQNNIFCNSTIDGYTDFIFLNRFGKVHNHADLNSSIKRIIRTCNDEIFLRNPEAEVFLPNFSCHTLRHTFTTRMCEAGINIKVVQAALGHSDVGTTLNIYASATESYKKEEFHNLQTYLND